MLRRPEVTTLCGGESDALLIPALVDAFLRRLGPDYASNAEGSRGASAQGAGGGFWRARARVRQQRMRLFNAAEGNTSAEGFIKIAPALDGRLSILNPEIVTADAQKAAQAA